MEGEAIDGLTPIPWWRQTIRYLGVCLVEAALSAVLIVVFYLVLVPLLTGESMRNGHLCAVFGLVVFGPALWVLSVLLSLAFKVVVVLLPRARRHWALAVYWLVSLAILGALLFEGASYRLDRARLEIGFYLYGALLMIPVSLTLSHFLLLPYVNPGSSARDVLRTLFRRRSAPPEAPGGLPPPPS